ncbi:MAG: hypothetical protein K0S56_1775 [Microvirga sp.]|nr:hypothetical protein [Microvirga sp.]
MLISVNMALLGAFWPVTDELLSTDKSLRTTFKPSSVLLPVPHSWPEQPELARPLFRVGPSPAEHEDPPGTGSSPNMRLLGIVLTEQRRIAVLERDGATLRVEEGDDLNGWQVARIEPRKVRLKNSEQHIDVLLDTPADAP